ncbi:MAG: serine hydrolase domain-containing protein [Candidatus Aminicenantia bacterium]
MLVRFLSSQIEKGTFPGVSFLIAQGEEILIHEALGYSVVQPIRIKATPQTIYDLASLTKPLVTASLSVLLFQEKAIKPADQLKKFYSGLDSDKKSIELIDLLTHQSGFPDWYPLYLEGQNKEELIDFLLEIPLQYKPKTKVVYSCLDYILMGDILEKITNQDLEELSQKYLFQPLGLKNTFFNPSYQLKLKIAATEKGNKYEQEKCGQRKKEYNGWRRDIIWGEVHDQNCFALGGAAGNSGLFSNTEEIYCFLVQFIKEKSILFKPDTLDFFYQNYTSHSSEHRSVGWQIASSEQCSAGQHFSPFSIGHTGFTGTSLWIDPSKEAMFIFLTNRLHPEYKEINFNIIRQKFHNLAWQQFISEH